MGMCFHPPTHQYPYPLPAVPIPMSAGGGFKRVWVWVSLQLPMGYPCYSLLTIAVYAAVAFLFFICK